MPRMLPPRDSRVAGWNAPPGGPGAQTLTQLPDELLAMVLKFLDVPSRARVALVCKPLAALAMQPSSPIWGNINLLEIRSQIEDWQDAEHHDIMLLSGSSVDALVRWWRRHAVGFNSVTLPSRFLQYQGWGRVDARRDLDDDDIVERQLLPLMLGMLASNPGMLRRLVIGQHGQPRPPLSGDCLPVIALCTGLQTLALWQLSVEGVAGSDAILASALQQLTNLQALALSWYSKPYDWEHDAWIDNIDTAPHRLKRCPLTLAAIAKCSMLRSLLLNGGKLVYVRELPTACSTALRALSSLELQDCFCRSIPSLPALKELTLCRPAAVNQLPLCLSQQLQLEALSATRYCFAGQLPPSLRRLVLTSSPAEMSALEMQNEMEDCAAALQGLPQLEHLVLRHFRFPDGRLPEGVVAAIDNLSSLSSLHLDSSYQAPMSAMPALKCLSRLRSFGMQGAQLPELPLQLAGLVCCTRIDLSYARFSSISNVETVLQGLSAVGASTEGGAAERELWLSGNGELKRRMAAFGGGIRVRELPFLGSLGVGKIMSERDFDDCAAKKS